ncbi:hypothetical protein HN873_049344 [Arachis hypogaea]
METLPFTDEHYELVEIDLYLSKIVHVWHGKKFLEKLKYLNLSNSHNLKQTPDLSGAPNLETLDLSCCSELNDIHQSLIHHKNLLELNLINCTGITELPTTVGNLVGLSELDLQGCKRLTCLPDTISGLKSLTALDVSDCPNLLLQSLDSLSTLTSLLLSWNKCVEVPISIHEFPMLRHLDLNDCRNLESFHQVLKKLEHLNLSNCHKLKQTPELCGALNLKTLDLSECKALNYIHPFLAHHKSLVELNLYGCSRLRRLPEFGEGMKQLSVLILTDTGIEELPTTPGKFAGVSKLDLSGCDKLTSLPLSLGCFVGLKELVLSRFMELSCVPYSTHGLESLTVEDYSDSPNIVGLLCSLSCFTSLSTLKLHVCFGTLSYNLGHLASLTDLDLSDNDFRQLPISILELPRLTRLQLYHCRFLEVLPEIPSSLRVLQADRCCSLVASKVYDAISKACCVFAESASQDREDFLQMLMPELYQEMPAWFEDQEEDNGVSLSSPSTEIIALALCFLLDGDKYSEEQPSVICNGKEFINTRLLKVSMSSYYKTLLILCLNGYSFSNLLCQDNRFQLQFPSDCCEIRVKRSGARWVCKQDVQLLKKRKYETGKRKATLKLNMDMISHSSASRNKMPVVDSPVYEEEVERATTLLASLRFASHST